MPRHKSAIAELLMKVAGTAGPSLTNENFDHYLSIIGDGGSTSASVLAFQACKECFADSDEYSTEEAARTLAWEAIEAQLNAEEYEYSSASAVSFEREFENELDGGDIQLHLYVAHELFDGKWSYVESNMKIYSVTGTEEGFETWFVRDGEKRNSREVTEEITEKLTKLIDDQIEYLGSVILEKVSLKEWAAAFDLSEDDNGLLTAEQRINEILG